MSGVGEETEARAAAAPAEPAVWDEMVTGAGGVRPHWVGLMGVVSALTPRGMAERAQRARRHFDQDGVTWQARDVPQEDSLPWEFDLLPLILAAEEWAGLEGAIAQRALLIDRLLQDLYGAQTLLQRRLLPPFLVHANPEFLRAARQSVGPRDWHRPRPFLQLYAADLVRGPDGQWRVLADRTDAPAGLGYALENRRVLARTLPEGFRGTAVRRLKPFYDLVQTQLQELAGLAGGREGRIVLLSRGRRDESYFEHVYLARELSLTLAEPADLTVREGAVFLKTLDGLEPVEVILRRIEGRNADPLDLGGDPALGVTGLMQAERAGTIAIANRIGSALAEAPGLAPYLPAAARALLDEELALASVETRWLGEPRHLAALVAQPAGWRVGPALPLRAPPPSPPLETLEAAERARLTEQLRRRPAHWIAWRQPSPSTGPAHGPDGLRPEPLLLRVFAIRRGDRFEVMTGGLARVARDAERVRHLRTAGRITKDVWIRAADRMPVVVPATGAGQLLAINRAHDGLPARIADNLFWFGRYLERIDSGARLLRTAVWRLAGGSIGPRDALEIRTLAATLGRAGLMEPQQAGALPDSAVMQAALTGIAAADGALQETLRALSGPAANLRERFSRDMWRTLTLLLVEDASSLTGAAADLDALIGALDGLIAHTAAIAGIASENMVRGNGWRFMDMGRRIERGVFTAWAVGDALAIARDHAEAALHLALELSDSTITYRTRYLASLQPGPVLDLVLADDGNPRALAYQLTQLIGHLAAVPARDGFTPGPELAQALQGVLNAVRAIGDAGTETGGGAAELRERLDQVAEILMTLSDRLSRAYFTMVAEAISLGFDRSAR